MNEPLESNRANVEDMARRIAAQAMGYPYKLWGFGEGIALRAVWEAGPALNEPSYRTWVQGMLDRWLAREPRLQEADHSAPGFSLLDAYEATGQRAYLDLALALAEQMAELPEADGGARFHRPQHPDYHHYLYVDCMEVDAPFFCRLAQVTGDGRWYDFGAGQLLAYAALLQDERSGLFYHQYDGETGRINGVFWGRGNGWAMLGLLETLRLLPRSHPDWPDIERRFTTLAEAIAACQRPDGDWPTVLDDASAYAEGSLPAMFGYAFTHAIQLGLLPERFQPVAELAWRALVRRVDQEGRLEGVSIATPPGTTAAHYRAIPAGGVYPWGQGPALLFCLARLGAG